MHQSPPFPLCSYARPFPIVLNTRFLFSTCPCPPLSDAFCNFSLKVPKLRSPVLPPFSCCPLLVPTLIHALAPAPPPPLWSRPLQRIPLLRTFLRATSLLAPPPLFWSRPPALRSPPLGLPSPAPLLHHSSPAPGWSSGVSSRSAAVCGWAGWLPGDPEMDAVAAGGAVRRLHNP